MARFYVDSDGLFSNFDAQVLKLFGTNIKGLGGDTRFWELANNHNDFWPTMDVMDGAHAFFERIKHLDVYVLTGVPKSNPIVSAAQKKTWWLEKFNMPEHRVITCLSRDKAKYVTSADDILVDDMKKNVLAFQNAGAKAILHKAFDTTIAELIMMKYLTE